jgi:hypothetical protein
VAENERERVLCEGEDAYGLEKTLRWFLLDHCDTLRLTAVTTTEIGFFAFRRYGGSSDPKFLKTLERLEPHFIEKIVNNKRFEDVEQGKRARFHHYLYLLTPGLKQLVDKETLFFDSMTSDNLYGFEDPTFYKNGAMIACTISHEDLIVLFLDKDERDTLEIMGVSFELEDHQLAPGNFLSARKTR